MQEDVLRPVPARRGHFLLESGHQGDRWLDLELLCLRPEPVRRLAVKIAARLASRGRRREWVHIANPGSGVHRCPTRGRCTYLLIRTIRA